MKWFGSLLGCLSLVAVSTALADPVNEKCPFSGEEVKAETAYTVAFCCGNCQGKFTKNPGKFIGKVKAVAVNAKCPMSGKAINPKITASYKGDLIGFCGAGCQKKFKGDPAALIKKVAFVKGKPVNDRCPLSGKEINPKKTYSLAFCCGKCSAKFKTDPVKHVAKVK